MVTPITHLQALEDLKKAKYLLMLVTVFNSTLFGTMAAVAAATGAYTLFVTSFLLCLVNIGLFANSYQRWRTL